MVENMNDFEVLNSRYHADWIAYAEASTDPAKQAAARQAARIIETGFAYLDTLPPALRQTLEDCRA